MITVNKKPFVSYFVRDWHREHATEPFAATSTSGKYNVLCTVHGGGLSGMYILIDRESWNIYRPSGCSSIRYCSCINADERGIPSAIETRYGSLVWAFDDIS